MVVAALACIFFVAAGWAFLPHLGVENDEALFAASIYDPASLVHVIIHHKPYPLMLMSYLGTLKGYLYKPIFRWFGTGLIPLRLPVILAAAGSIWLFFLLLRRIAGTRAATIGTWLLATDAVYLLTATFDWGPVALQHVLMTGGLLLLICFYRSRDWRQLAGGFFLFGLAMWDKSLAAWMISGFAVGGILTVPRRILDTLSWRRIAIAILAFAMGALPLIVFNVKNQFETFHNVHYENHIRGSAQVLRLTVNGEGLFDWLVLDDWRTKHPHAPATPVARLSAQISAAAGHPRHNLMVWALLLALLVAPLSRGNDLRALLFCLIAAAVAFFQMATNANTGGSLHHTILIWPLPQLFVAVSLAAASRRLGSAGIPAVATLAAVVCLSGVLVINEYYTLMLRNGASPAWTEAIFNLSDYLKTAPARHMYYTDWAFIDPLRMLHRGRLPLSGADDPVSKPVMTDEDRQMARRIVTDPEGIILAHTPEYEFFPNNKKLVEFAAGIGYRPEVIRDIYDNYGRHAYQVYRFVPAGR